MKIEDIKSWVDAIDVTIKMHQKAIDTNTNYCFIDNPIKNNDNNHCPLCCYLTKILKSPIGFDCDKCIWTKYTGHYCMADTEFDYYNDEESIRRLKHWRELELKDK